MFTIDTDYINAYLNLIAPRLKNQDVLCHSDDDIIWNHLYNHYNEYKLSSLTAMVYKYNHYYKHVYDGKIENITPLYNYQGCTSQEYLNAMSASTAVVALIQPGLSIKYFMRLDKYVDYYLFIPNSKETLANILQIPLDSFIPRPINYKQMQNKKYHYLDSWYGDRLEWDYPWGLENDMKEQPAQYIFITTDYHFKTLSGKPSINILYSTIHSYLNEITNPKSYYTKTKQDLYNKSREFNIQNSTNTLPNEAKNQYHHVIQYESFYPSLNEGYWIGILKQNATEWPNITSKTYGKWIYPYMYYNYDHIDEIICNIVDNTLCDVAKFLDCLEIALAENGTCSGIACLYCDFLNIEQHISIITYLRDNNLLPRTARGKYINMAYKLDYQTIKSQYSKNHNFIATLKLSDFIDLYTGKYLDTMPDLQSRILM